MSHNPSEPASDVAIFLMEQYQASLLNAFRSAISSAHYQVDGVKIGKHPLLCLVMKGAM